MAIRPTWNTKVLDSINRMMIRFRRMAVSWILCEGREKVCELQTQNIAPAEVFVSFFSIQMGFRYFPDCVLT